MIEPCGLDDALLYRGLTLARGIEANADERPSLVLAGVATALGRMAVSALDHEEQTLRMDALTRLWERLQPIFAGSENYLTLCCIGMVLNDLANTAYRLEMELSIEEEEA